MLTKKLLASLAGIAVISVAATAYAATASTTTPQAPAAAEMQAMPKIDMAAAVAAAQKAYPGEAFRAALRTYPGYGLVWDVCIEKKDGARVHALVNSETGDVTAADVKGIRGMQGGRGAGFYGYPCPMMQGAPCPNAGYGPGSRMHHGYGMHYGW